MNRIRSGVTVSVIALLGILLPMSPALGQSHQPVSTAVMTQETGDEGDVLRDFIEIGPDGEPYFDRDAAARAGVDAEVLALGDAFNRYAVNMGSDEAQSELDTVPYGPYPGEAQAGTLHKALRIPVWGNWCGPGYGAGTPKDTLDALCMEHDLCYGERGYWDCQCDYDLIYGITEHLDRMGFRQRFMAIIVREFFRARYTVGGC